MPPPRCFFLSNFILPSPLPSGDGNVTHPVKSWAQCSPSPAPLSFSDHPRKENSFLALNFCSTYYFSIHLALGGDLSGDVLLSRWNRYSKSAGPFASSYASVLTLPLDCKVLFIDVCLILLWIPPKMPITFPYLKNWIRKSRLTLVVPWNVYHLSFDKAKSTRADLPSRHIIILLQKPTEHLLLWVNFLLRTWHAGSVHCDPVPGRAYLWAKISTKSHVGKNRETYQNLKTGFLEFNSSEHEFLGPGLF